MDYPIRSLSIGVLWAKGDWRHSERTGTCLSKQSTQVTV